MLASICPFIKHDYMWHETYCLQDDGDNANYCKSYVAIRRTILWLTLKIPENNAAHSSWCICILQRHEFNHCSLLIQGPVDVEQSVVTIAGYVFLFFPHSLQNAEIGDWFLWDVSLDSPRPYPHPQRVLSITMIYRQCIERCRLQAPCMNWHFCGLV